MLGSLAAALVALGALATGVSAAKPKLWLLHLAENTRAATGSPVHISVSAGDECGGTQLGALHSNGKPVDQITPGSGSSFAVQCASSGKLAGSIKTVTVAPVGEEMTMTLNSALYVEYAPWCTYSLPHKITFEASTTTEANVEPTAPLDKAASFGSCAPIRRVPMRLVVDDDYEGAAFRGEVVG